MPRADSAGAAYGTCHRLVTDDEAGGGGAALAPSGLQARRGRADMRSMKHIALSADFDHELIPIVLVERRHNALGNLVTSSEATVKLVVDGERLLSVAEGNGPVDALNHALVKDLGKYAGYLGSWRLVDYKVRIISPKAGTAAVTRVVIESTDESDIPWSTIGVSANIIDASFQALTDSITYKLLRENAPV